MVGKFSGGAAAPRQKIRGWRRESAGALRGRARAASVDYRGWVWGLDENSMLMGLMVFLKGIGAHWGPSKSKLLA